MGLSKKEDWIKGRDISTFKIGGMSTLIILSEQGKIYLSSWPTKQREGILDEPVSRQKIN